MLSQRCQHCRYVLCQHYFKPTLALCQHCYSMPAIIRVNTSLCQRYCLSTLHAKTSLCLQYVVLTPICKAYASTTLCQHYFVPTLLCANTTLSALLCANTTLCRHYFYVPCVNSSFMSTVPTLVLCLLCNTSCGRHSLRAVPPVCCHQDHTVSQEKKKGPVNTCPNFARKGNVPKSAEKCVFRTFQSCGCEPLDALMSRLLHNRSICNRWLRRKHSTSTFVAVSCRHNNPGAASKPKFCSQNDKSSQIK